MEPIKVFLSYVHEDYLPVKEIYDRFKRIGISPWMDKENILPGEDWERSILRSVQQSDFILVFLSNNSVTKRGFFQKEIKIALKLWEEKLEDDIFIIPLLLNECDVPESIKKIQWIDFNNENSFHKIIESIKIGSQKLGKSISFDSNFISVTKKRIQESLTKELSYFIDVEYPQIEIFGSNLFDEVNSIIGGKIISMVQHARQEGKAALDDEEFRESFSSYNSTNDLYINYQIEHVSLNLLSIQFTISTYSAGAAHPLHGILTFNFELKPTIQLDFTDIFNTETNYLETVSAFCVKNLIDQLDSEEDFSYSENPKEFRESAIQWIKEGAAPEINKLNKFCINENGLVVLFDDYAVGPYSWGHRRVEIPYSYLNQFIVNKIIREQFIIK